MQTRIEGLFRYLRLTDLDAYLRRGWMVIDHLGHHGEWSVLGWHCACGEVEP